MVQGETSKKEEENEEKGSNKGENGEWGGDSKKEIFMR